MAYIITTLANRERLPEDPIERHLLLKLNRWLTSLRQGSEWVNHTLKQTFLRLSLRLPWQPEKATPIVETCVLLHNLRGIGQLRTVYRELTMVRLVQLEAMYDDLEAETGVSRNDLNDEAEPAFPTEEIWGAPGEAEEGV